jgi:glycosyltransferase involved in cell wall biosynthesis
MEKFTIIVPTKDRCATLRHTLRTCLNQTYENFEVLVSDNCSQDETSQVVSELSNPKLRYVRTPRPLSMSENFEFALGHVNEGFVIFIGDDDGLYPDAVARAAAISSKFNVKVIAGKTSTYIWPDFPDESIRDAAWIGMYRKGVELRRSLSWIQKTIDFKYKYCFDLPSVYCGFVHLSVLNKSRTVDGRYFNSITPDAYSAFATAFSVPTYAYSHQPLVIAGSSARSNGASQMREKVNSSEADDYVSKVDLKLAQGFVYCPGFESILYEALYKYLELFPENKLKVKIPLRRMLEISLGEVNSKTRVQVESAVMQMCKNFNVSYEGLKPRKFPLFQMQLRRFPYFIFALLNNYPYGIKNASRHGVRNIYDATLVMHALVNRRAHSLASKFLPT